MDQRSALMQSQLVVAAGPASLTTIRQCILTPLEKAWPREGFPANVFPVGITALLEVLAAGDGSWTDACAQTDDAVALLVFDDNTSAHLIDIAAETLRSRHLPAVIICERPCMWQTFQHGGIMFEARGVPASTLAIMLQTLRERQREVCRLLTEVRLTQRCAATVRGEMERVHEELQLAASIQREFTRPALPSRSDVDLHVLSRPVNFVSGDMVCVRSHGEHHLTFFLGDAAGHGVPAALLTMVLAHALDTAAAHPPGDDLSFMLKPAALLDYLNRRVCAHCRGIGWFATAVYGVLDVHSGELVIAGAGHPPPLLLSDGRNGPPVESLHEIVTAGPVLGIAPDAIFTQNRLMLTTKDVLCVYSDGLEGIFPDAPPGSSMRDRERPHLKHLELLANSVAVPTDNDSPDVLRMSRWLDLVIDEQAGSLHPSDDITALFIQRRAEAVVRRLAA